MCCKVTVVNYSFFFHAIVAGASMADFRGKVGINNCYLTGSKEWFISSVYN